MGDAASGPSGCAVQGESMCANWRKAQEQMLRTVEDEARAAAYDSPECRLDPRVLEAMRQVARHEFVAPDMVPLAYKNRPLRIGSGQTISQPFIVALMTSLLEVGETDTVLEIGTGSGYQAAVLAQLAHHVYSVERIPSLYEWAAQRLHRLGQANVSTHCGDGRLGWEEFAPFERVMVTAASEDVPAALVTQLGPGGRLVLPEVDPAGYQWLTVLDKRPSGQIEKRRILGVRFVPLRHGVG
jgi:protein-L-isoaspartate(D-aspartate) O-methyltransferase